MASVDNCTLHYFINSVNKPKVSMVPLSLKCWKVWV